MTKRNLYGSAAKSEAKPCVCVFEMQIKPSGYNYKYYTNKKMSFVFYIASLLTSPLDEMLT